MWRRCRWCSSGAGSITRQPEIAPPPDGAAPAGATKMRVPLKQAPEVAARALPGAAQPQRAAAAGGRAQHRCRRSRISVGRARWRTSRRRRAVATALELPLPLARPAVVVHAHRAGDRRPDGSATASRWRNCAMRMGRRGALARAALPAALRDALDALRDAVGWRHRRDCLGGCDGPGAAGRRSKARASISAIAWSGSSGATRRKRNRPPPRRCATSRRSAARCSPTASTPGARAQLHPVSRARRPGADRLDATRGGASRRRSGGRRLIGDPVVPPAGPTPPRTAGGSRASGGGRAAHSWPPGSCSAASRDSCGSACSRTTSGAPTRPTRSAPRSAFPTCCRICSAKARSRRRSSPCTRRLLARGEREEADRVAGAVAALLALAVSVLVLVGVARDAVDHRPDRAGIHRRSPRPDDHAGARSFSRARGCSCCRRGALASSTATAGFCCRTRRRSRGTRCIIATLLAFGGRQEPEPTGRHVRVGLGGRERRCSSPCSSPRCCGSRARAGCVRALRSPEVRTVAQQFRAGVREPRRRAAQRLRRPIPRELAAYRVRRAASATPRIWRCCRSACSAWRCRRPSCRPCPAWSGTADDVASTLRARLDDWAPPHRVLHRAVGDGVRGAGRRDRRRDLSDGPVHGRATRCWVWAILAGSAVGLLASTLGRLYSSAYYALRDTRTPLRFALLRVALTTGLGYVCALPLPRLLGIDPRWGMAGLTRIRRRGRLGRVRAAPAVTQGPRRLDRGARAARRVAVGPRSGGGGGGCGAEHLMADRAARSCRRPSCSRSTGCVYLGLARSRDGSP